MRHDRGHRALGHTADVLIEAWGPTRCACLEEAALGLVDTFADTGRAESVQRHRVTLGPDADEELLVSLLDEVIYVLDTSAMVPVSITLEDRADHGIDGWFDVVPAGDVEVTGALPKGVSRSDLVIETDERGWVCRVEIDV
jgi:SHS2 domain-containing protein